MARTADRAAASARWSKPSRSRERGPKPRGERASWPAKVDRKGSVVDVALRLERDGAGAGLDRERGQRIADQTIANDAREIGRIALGDREPDGETSVAPRGVDRVGR